MKKEFLTLIATVLMLTFLPKAYPQQNTKEEYEKLKKAYEKLLAERDNFQMQNKSLLEYKTNFLELTTKTKILQEEKENKIKLLQQDKESTVKSLQQEKETTIKKMQEERDQLKLELEKIKGQLIKIENLYQEESAAFQQGTIDLEKKNTQLSKDKEDTQDSLEKLEIEYKIIPETKKKVLRLERENELISNDYNKMQQKFKRMEAERINKDAQIEIYRMQIKDLKKQYEEAMAKNKELQVKAEQIPGRFAELAHENKVLIKETALMHYNLGVFYTKNKEYPRAIAEFEKAIELNPDDPYGHYNLGYIYAEYLADRPKAVAHFRKFLGLSKTEDRDAEWVKKYILTWQTWEGKKPMQ